MASIRLAVIIVELTVEIDKAPVPVALMKVIPPTFAIPDTARLVEVALVPFRRVNEMLVDVIEDPLAVINVNPPCKLVSDVTAKLVVVALVPLRFEKANPVEK